jgi:RNA polymerase sigma-70 factor (ECF subfamily)
MLVQLDISSPAQDLVMPLKFGVVAGFSRACEPLRRPIRRRSVIPTHVRLVPSQEPAFAEIYVAHAPAARRLALTILRDEHLAADAVQEAFVSLWLLGELYRPDRGGYWALLRTLVHHRAVDILRSRGSGPRTVPLDGVIEAVLVDSNRGPEGSVLASDEAGRVLTAVNALAPAKREVLVLAYGQGHSHSQIAGLLRVPLGTVKARIRAAKIDLTAVLSPQLSLRD